MASHELLFHFLPDMAKPGIPVTKPKRRQIPDVPDPMPKRTPIPAEPVRPREPVPVRS